MTSGRDQTGAADDQLPGTGRLEAFSDGVIAIAITLLILEVRPPEGIGGGRLLDDLLQQWPAYVTYALTFLIIGIMWVNHHGLCRVIVAVNRPVLYLNLAVLMGIAFLPFPTSLFAKALQTDSLADRRTAAFVYSLTLLVIGLAWTGFWAYLRARPQLLIPALGRDGATAALRRVAVGPAVYGAACLVALISPYLCLVAHAVAAVFFLRGRRDAPVPV